MDPQKQKFANWLAPRKKFEIFEISDFRNFKKFKKILESWKVVTAKLQKNLGKWLQLSLGLSNTLDR